MLNIAVRIIKAMDTGGDIIKVVYCDRCGVSIVEQTDVRTISIVRTNEPFGAISLADPNSTIESADLCVRCAEKIVASLKHMDEITS